MSSNDLIIGAVGPLQFDVASFRLASEYGVDCRFEPVAVTSARWIECSDAKELDRFTSKLVANLARDHSGKLVYLAQSSVNLTLTQERWPAVAFNATREHLAA